MVKTTVIKLSHITYFTTPFCHGQTGSSVLLAVRFLVGVVLDFAAYELKIHVPIQDGFTESPMDKDNHGVKLHIPLEEERHQNPGHTT